MSEMVERVAQAIEAACKFAPKETLAWKDVSRVAIAAMREPTADMLRGGLCGWNGVEIAHELSKYQSADGTWDAWRRAWRGMIDAALADETMTAPAVPETKTVA